MAGGAARPARVHGIVSDVGRCSAGARCGHGPSCSGPLHRGGAADQHAGRHASTRIEEPQARLHSAARGQPAACRLIRLGAATAYRPACFMPSNREDPGEDCPAPASSRLAPATPPTLGFNTPSELGKGLTDANTLHTRPNDRCASLFRAWFSSPACDACRPRLAMRPASRRAAAAHPSTCH